ncbi:MAG TPA: hypothetical protein VHW24_24905, partial [Bryobacteraceae bacterium]|nr:hypothetical protein [Bryobacteraceae bacterium]
PGKYLLRAETDSNPTGMFVPEFLTATGEHASEGEVATYFSSTVQANDAKTITLKEGEEISGLVISLRKAAMRRVTGHLSKELMISNLRLNPIRDGEMSISVPVNADGSFERGGVPAGLYNLSFQNESSAVSGSLRVDLTAADADGLTFEPRQGFSARITLRLERNGALAQPGDAFVGFESIPSGQGGTSHATLAGEYAIDNLLAGRYHVNIYAGSESYFLKRMTIAGKAASPDDFELREAPPEPVELILSANFAKIEGRVAETASKAVTALLVDPTPRDGKMNIKRRAQCDQNGLFQIERVPPGKYLLYAIEDFDATLWGSPEIAATLQSSEIPIKEGETAQVEAKLTAAAAWNAATERLLK